jgi:mono/diheme cytochrome c family protein
MQRAFGKFCVGAGAVLWAVCALPAQADTARGRLLYENHCQGCHTSTVHIREQRKVTSPAELRAFIARWAAELKLKWTDDEHNDVYSYLNERHYKLRGTSSP